VDSYSGFFDNYRGCATGLGKHLALAGITEVFCCGLALDFCVGSTAIDAQELGFNAYLIEDCCRAVAPESLATMKQKLEKAGVKLCMAKGVPEIVASAGKQPGSPDSPALHAHSFEKNVHRFPSMTTPRGAPADKGSFDNIVPVGGPPSFAHLRNSYVRQESENAMQEVQLAPAFRRRTNEGKEEAGGSCEPPAE